MGIATNDATAAALAWVAASDLEDRFEFVTGADGGHGAKPGPGMVEGFCRLHGLAAAEVAMVGDSAHDMATARAAGCGLAVAVLGGVAGRAVLAPLADRVIDSVADLEGALSLV